MEVLLDELVESKDDVLTLGLIGAGVYASHGYERSHVKGLETPAAYIKTYLG